MRRATAVRSLCFTALAFVSASAFASSSAHAARVDLRATEAHALGDDVRLSVAPNGHAAVAHQLRWQVVAGALHTFDLAGIEEGAVLRPDIDVTGDDGTHWTAHMAWFAPRVVRITTDDAHGLHKGTYRFDLAYEVDLTATRELVREGAMWRLAWTSPNAIEGFDAARVTFDLPAAPTAPRADMGGENGDDGVVATVQRNASRDALDIERPHVGRGESVIWAVRLDPRALPELAAAHDAAIAAARGGHDAAFTTSGGEMPVVTRWRRAFEGFAICAFGLLYGLTVRRRKGRPLVDASPRVRAALSGLSLAGGLGLHCAGKATLGAALVAAAMLVATVRAAGTTSRSRKPAARGPGAWSELPPSEAFAKSPVTARSRWASRLVAVARAFAVVALVMLAAVAARSAAPEYALAALDALALIPLLVGGGTEPSSVERARPRLARAFRSVAKRSELHVTPWGRRPVGRTAVDELRLRVAPLAPMPGAGGVELGFAADSSGAAIPEVLVRVHATSCASARIAALAPWASSVPGRTPEERVIRLSPRWPSLRLAERLTERMALALVDRRDEHDPDAPFAGKDRRAARSAAGVPQAPDSAPDASLLLLR